MIKSSLFIMFNGESSRDYKILNVNVSGSMLEEPLLPSRNIIETKIRARKAPYLQEVEEEPLEFTLQLYIDEDFKDYDMRKLARWFNVDYYKPLIFSEDTGRIFYAMPVGESRILHNGIQGYVEITMRCDSPYSYSPVYTSEIYNLENNPSEGTVIEFINMGDVECKPNVYINKINEGDISIVNLSDYGKEFKFVDLAHEENVFVDCENEHIETDLDLTYRYDQFSNYFLRFPRGVNRLKVYGTCVLYFKYQFKTLQ